MGAVTYERALKAGQKEYKACVAQGRDPYLAALEQETVNRGVAGEEALGLVSIPMERIVGTRNTARRDCFSPSFLPLLEENSEFAAKWGALSTAHVSEGIRDAIVAVEYMNRYYVVEGHKRVSVLRYFGSPTVAATVTRLLPVPSDTQEYRVYQEFLEFYRRTRVNYISFEQPGKYGKLLEYVDKGHNPPWDFERQREFFADCTRFRRAYQEIWDQTGLDRDEALLRYLKIYGYEHLSQCTPAGLQRDLQAIIEELHTDLEHEDPELGIEPETAEPQQPSIFRRLIIDTKPRVLKVAFLHDKNPESSWWTEAHEKGRIFAQSQLGRQIETVSFFNMLQDDPDAKMAELAQNGYSLIFTTTPRLLESTLRAAAKYPNVKFLNCSLNTKHPILRTYYGRMYEAKFLTGALAGACCGNGRLGYICNYPVFGAPASINAFALGAKMVSANARVHLEWSTIPGNDVISRFREQQVEVVSGHDLYSPDQQRWGAGVYMLDDPQRASLGVSTWNWGQIYERIISGALYGQWYIPGFVDKRGKAINYWWGLNSHAVGVSCSEEVPRSTRRLIEMLGDEIVHRNLCVFEGPIYDQQGNLRVKEGEVLSSIQIVQMDWLVDNVVGTIPAIDQLTPDAQALIQISGVMKREEP